MEGSSGDQWTQPRGALHSLGYYVVSPPLRSNTMPAATYYARRYYTGRPSVPRASPSSPRSVPLFFCRAARRLRTFPSRILTLYSRNFALALSLSLYLFISRSLSLLPPSSAQHEHPRPPALTSIRQWRRGVGCRARENSSLHAYTHRRGSLPRPARLSPPPPPPQARGYAGDGCRIHIPRWWTDARASSPVWR